MSNKDLLVYVASFFMLILLVSILGYLTYIPVPQDNKELIITILGVLLGGAAAAMPNLFGSKDTETEQLRTRLRSTEEHLAVLEAKYITLKESHDKMVAMLIERHVVTGEGNAHTGRA